MNYQRIYDQIIERAKSENRQKGTGIYYEKHHIIPRCLGGSNNKDNLVFLTAREHFLCHWLLSRIYNTNKLIQYAFWRMCIKGNSYQNRICFSSIAYEEIREKFIKIQSNKLKNKTGYWKGKIRLDRRGSNHPMYGKGYKQTGSNNPMYNKPAHNRRKVKDLLTGNVYESLKQASIKLGVSIPTIHSWVKKGIKMEYLIR